MSYKEDVEISAELARADHIERVVVAERARIKRELLEELPQMRHAAGPCEGYLSYARLLQLLDRIAPEEG